MNSAKTLEKASILFAKIQELDKDIIRIDKQAMLLANAICEVKLKLHVKDLTPPKPKKEDILDPDGSLIYKGNIAEQIARQMALRWGIDTNDANQQKQDKPALDEVLNVYETLEILGILLRHKQAERSELINELEKMGFVL